LNNRENRENRNRKLITYLDSKSPISESFRTLRTNIQFASVDKEIKTIMVSSSGPAEGKSTICPNLAVVMGQAGKRTLLIDANMRRPSIHDTFRMLNSEGLSNILVGQKNLDELIQESGINNLDILTSGPIPPNPAELLSSKAMSRLIETVHDLYDIVVFDTPALIAVSDGLILGSQVDGVLLIIDSGGTSRDMGLKAKSLLNKAKANILGCVLNNRKL
jgi:protein-tyrosine kinase